MGPFLIELGLLCPAEEVEEGAEGTDPGQVHLRAHSLIEQLPGSFQLLDVYVMLYTWIQGLSLGIHFLVGVMLKQNDQIHLGTQFYRGANINIIVL